MFMTNGRLCGPNQPGPWPNFRDQRRGFHHNQTSKAVILFLEFCYLFIFFLDELYLGFLVRNLTRLGCNFLFSWENLYSCRVFGSFIYEHVKQCRGQFEFGNNITFLFPTRIFHPLQSVADLGLREVLRNGQRVICNFFEILD